MVLVNDPGEGLGGQRLSRRVVDGNSRLRKIAEGCWPCITKAPAEQSDRGFFVSGIRPINRTEASSREAGSEVQEGQKGSVNLRNDFESENTALWARRVRPANGPPLLHRR